MAAMMTGPPQSSDVSQETAVGARRKSPAFLSRDYLFADVNPDQLTWPMAAYCFMTGFM